MKLKKFVSQSNMVRFSPNLPRALVACHRSTGAQWIWCEKNKENREKMIFSKARRIRTSFNYGPLVNPVGQGPCSLSWVIRSTIDMVWKNQGKWEKMVFPKPSKIHNSIKCGQTRPKLGQNAKENLPSRVRTRDLEIDHFWASLNEFLHWWTWIDDIVLVGCVTPLQSHALPTELRRAIHYFVVA